MNQGGGGMVIGGMQEGGEIRFLGEQNKTKIYKSKKYRKIIRLMTVMGYVFSVSLAAIVLSLYYVFLWDPNMQTSNKSLQHVHSHFPQPCAVGQQSESSNELSLTPAPASTIATVSESDDELNETATSQIIV